MLRPSRWLPALECRTGCQHRMPPTPPGVGILCPGLQFAAPGWRKSGENRVLSHTCVLAPPRRAKAVRRTANRTPYSILLEGGRRILREDLSRRAARQTQKRRPPPPTPPLNQPRIMECGNEVTALLGSRSERPAAAGPQAPMREEPLRGKSKRHPDAALHIPSLLGADGEG